jgi:hypothetical protein
MPALNPRRASRCGFSRTFLKAWLCQCYAHGARRVFLSPLAIEAQEFEFLKKVFCVTFLLPFKRSLVFVNQY